MNHAIMRHCVFIDECGYKIDLDCRKSRDSERVRQGERAYTVLCKSNASEMREFRSLFTRTFH